MAGKILCPNERCKAKLGNYDWAGIACGCKEWVTPVRRSFIQLFMNLPVSRTSQGFCIARAKVDETV
jgi:dual specificity phosphatase 12